METKYQEDFLQEPTIADRFLILTMFMQRHSYVRIQNKLELSNFAMSCFSSFQGDLILQQTKEISLETLQLGHNPQNIIIDNYVQNNMDCNLKILWSS